MHAGGESYQCTTQLTLVKAWTSLPVREEIRGGKEGYQGGDNDGRTGGSQEASDVMDTTTLLVEALFIQL